MKLPPRWIPDASLSLCKRCLTVDFFFSSLFFKLLHSLFSLSYSTLFVLTSFSLHYEYYETAERTIPRARTSSRSIVFIPFLRCLVPRGWLEQRRHSWELIEPFHSTRRFSVERFQSFQWALVVPASVFNKKPTSHRRRSIPSRDGFLERDRVSRAKSTDHGTTLTSTTRFSDCIHEQFKYSRYQNTPLRRL